MPDYVPDIRGDEKGRKIDKSSKRQTKRSKAGEGGGVGEGGGDSWLLLGNNEMVKYEKEETMRQTQTDVEQCGKAKTKEKECEWV